MWKIDVAPARRPPWWWCLVDTVHRMTQPFMTALRGYDMAQVEALLKHVDDALASGSEAHRATAREMIEAVQFRQRFRGYARHEVDQAVKERLQQLT
ncbi:DivIVA domain-containing protein [Micromonosporaceae bacterium Da 78-11]